MPYKQMSLEKTVVGTYKWKLIFDYDNSGNSASINHKIEYSRTEKVSSRQFLKNTFKVNAAFDYKQEASAKVSLTKVGDASSTITATAHLDTAYELVQESETKTDIDQTHKESKDYTVGPKSRFTLYQLCYTMDGVDVATDTLASTNGRAPDPDVTVPLTFSCTTSVLGFPDIVDQLFKTVPGSSNVEEWARIRQNITLNRDASEEEAFYQLVTTLNSTVPGRDNKDEWARIRVACSHILDSWADTDKTLLLKVLLSQFADTRPSNDNKDEWEAIRNVSNAILTALREVWAEPTSAAIARVA